MVIVINPSAGGGKAFQKWQRIESNVRAQLGSVALLVLNGNMNMRESVGKMLSEGHTEFIAAGGDGTVNLLLEAIMESAPLALLPRVKMGAIGLGSSNDFHKPFRDDKYIEGVPCKIDFHSIERRDVGLITFEDDKGTLQTRYWIVNASIGITAEANLFFNMPDAVLRFLKRSATSGAILYAALHTIASHQNREMTITIGDGQPIHTIQTCVTNLGIVKSPHFSGNFCYDSLFKPDSGYFDIHLCEKMSLSRTLVTLWKLSQKKFSGLPSTRSWQSSCLTVQADQQFAIEFDGEVVSTRIASLSIKHKLLKVCT